MLESLQAMRISEDDRRKILGGNAKEAAALVSPVGNRFPVLNISD